LGIVETDVTAFNDIPLHRVRYFKLANGDEQTVLWDRTKRIDLFATMVNDEADTVSIASTDSNTTTTTSTSTTVNSKLMEEQDVDNTTNATPQRSVSGRQKKALLQMRRSAKREDARAQLLETVENKLQVHMEQAAELQRCLNLVARQQKRLIPFNNAKASL
jgi:CCR4-NOT transcriptional regulation complex NOT5 subunit